MNTNEYTKFFLQFMNEKKREECWLDTVASYNNIGSLQSIRESAEKASGPRDRNGE
jgi:hypothetical protein